MAKHIAFAICRPCFMREMWLSSNRRALWFGCVPPLLIALLGVWLLLATSDNGPGWERWTGIAAIAIGALGITLLLAQLSRPRIAYRDGEVVFYLRGGTPLGVPVGIVEAFFLGQGPAALPGKIGRREKTLNLVARLSQRETSWAQRTVKPALGQWREGYITIRGTWCEPLNTEVIRRLNRRLKEVQQMSAQDQRGTTAHV